MAGGVLRRARRGDRPRVDPAGVRRRLACAGRQPRPHGRRRGRRHEVATLGQGIENEALRARNRRSVRRPTPRRLRRVCPDDRPHRSALAGRSPRSCISAPTMSTPAQDISRTDNVAWAFAAAVRGVAPAKRQGGPDYPLPRLARIGAPSTGRVSPTTCAEQMGVRLRPLVRPPIPGLRHAACRDAGTSLRHGRRRQAQVRRSPVLQRLRVTRPSQTDGIAKKTRRNLAVLERPTDPGGPQGVRGKHRVKK